MALYDHGPGSDVLPDKLKRELIAAELYPHGPVVVGEGDSERIIVDWLVQRLLGLPNAFEFHDLEGSGAAKRIARLVESFESYATGAFVVVDNEGEMSRYLQGLIAKDKIDERDVLLAKDSLEHDNFTFEELIATVATIGANPPAGRAASQLQLTTEQLAACHKERRGNARHNKPGVADTLLMMVRRDEHGNVTLSKSELAEGLAALLVRELDGVDSEQARAAIKRERPIVGFVIDRICPALNPSRPLS